MARPSWVPASLLIPTKCAVSWLANTILLAEVTEEEAATSPISAENKRRLDAAYEVVSKATDANGNPYKILRIPASGHIQYIQRPGDDLYDYYHELVGDAFMDGHPLARG